MQLLIIPRQNFNIENNLQQQQQSRQDGNVNNKTEPQDPEKKPMSVEQTKTAYIKS